MVCWQKWTDEYCVRKASSTVDRLRYMCLATNTDQDCSVNEVDSNTGDKLNAQRNSMPGGANLIPAGSGVVGHSPVGESQSRGRVEKAIRPVQERMRAVKSDGEQAQELTSVLSVRCGHG